jgi:hypothetical protein
MKARKFKDGGVSQCFECGAQLVRIKGGFIFAEVRDPMGYEVRVHKDCLQHAVGHGYSAVPAKEREQA